MNPTISRRVIAKTMPSGWSFALYLAALIAAIMLAAPCVHAADVDVTPSIVAGSKVPGGTYQLTGGYTINDGSSVNGYKWEQEEGTAVLFSSDTVQNPTVTLGTATDYAAYLKEVLREPPITAADLPKDLNLQDINQIEKGLQDRNQVVAINPLAFEKGEEVVLKFTVSTTSGDYSAELAVTTELPWGVSTGVRTVPVMVPVLLYAKNATDYNWSITSAPGGSTATLTDPTTQTPWFTPDKNGTYLVEETNSGATLDVHAGLYHGVIDPVLTLNSVLYGDGLPVGDPNCTSCHDGGAAPDNFTPWRTTGHAEAFTQGITTNGHFGTGCFACHTVGYGLDGPDFPNGIDDTPNYTAFLNLLSSNQAAGTISGTWEEMLDPVSGMPDTARLSNIQCENCHGPQDYTEAHRNKPGAPRVSLSADVCGSCHGEPARHGRFQQWQLSNHADYELAAERGAEDGNCARCHSGNGFVAWDDLNFDPNQEVDVTWDADTVVPQTCAACHNPHDTGSTSGGPDTNARVRVNGFTGGTCGGTDENPERCDTYELLAGFVAPAVGRGATCMTCHNSRNGLRNDATWASLSDSQKDDTPHHGVQADLIMGQNMYFMNSDDLVRGKHSLIPDTCATCHMEKTLPPEIFSYNRGGTNHTFAADPNICSQCHGDNSVSADNIDTIVSSYMDDLTAALGDAWMRLMAANYPVTIGGACGTADVNNKGKNGVNNPITNVEWVYAGFRGIRLNVTVGGNTCSNLDPASILVGKTFNNTDKNTTLKDLSLQPGNDVLWKAMWNYGLIYEDETINAGDPPPHTARGVHNPDFSIKGLTRAITAVKALNP